MKATRNHLKESSSFNTSGGLGLFETKLMFQIIVLSTLQQCIYTSWGWIVAVQENPLSVLFIFFVFLTPVAEREEKSLYLPQKQKL